MALELCPQTWKQCLTMLGLESTILREVYLLQDTFLGISSHFIKLECLSIKIFTNGQIFTNP